MNDFEKLKKQDNKIPPMNETLQGQAFETAKRKITGICKSLSYPTDLYKSEYTINSINAYLGISESFGRILYSQISNYVFDLEPNDRATFVSNLGMGIHAHTSSLWFTSDQCHLPLLGSAVSCGIRTDHRQQGRAAAHRDSHTVRQAL